MQFLNPNKHVRLTSNDSVDIQRLSESQSAGYERITQLLNTDTQLRSDLKPLVPSVHGYHCLMPPAASVHNDPDGFRCWKLNKWNVFRNKQTKKNKNYAEKRYRRGASNRKHVEDSNNLLADYLNSYSLQKMKGLLGIIRARDTDDIPVHSVELRINYQDVKVELGDLLNSVNSDLQNWALGFTDDEELDEAYFGEISPSDDNCNEFTNNCNIRRGPVTPLLLWCLAVLFCAFIALTIYIVLSTSPKLEVNVKSVPLAPLSCDSNIRLFGRFGENVTILTAQKDSDFNYLIYNQANNTLTTTRRLPIGTDESCVQIASMLTCCRTFCVWWYKDFERVRERFQLGTQSNKLQIEDFIESGCPHFKSNRCDSFPKLLLRNESDLNIIFDLKTNQTIAKLSGPKKDKNSVLAITLFDNTAVFLSRDEESNSINLCESKRWTSIERLDIPIKRCWRVQLPDDLNVLRELVKYKIIRISSKYYAIVASTTRRHRILWNVRFYELKTDDSSCVVLNGEFKHSSYACAFATDVLSRLSADRGSIVIEFVEQSFGGNQLALERYSVRIPQIV